MMKYTHTDRSLLQYEGYKSKCHTQLHIDGLVQDCSNCIANDLQIARLLPNVSRWRYP